MPERDLQTHVSALLQTLRREARQLDVEVRFHDVGTVQQVGSSVATLSGLPNAQMDELVTFPTGVQGMVLDLNRQQLNAVLLGSGEGIQGGDLVTGTGRRLRVPVGSRLLGRVLNPLGKPLDGRRPVVAAEMRHLERDAPRIVARDPVDEPLYTGLKVIDALVPIGRGQRELIVGERRTGKTTLAVDTILNQRDSGVRCVYVAVGQKKSSTLGVIQTLREHGAMAHTTVIVAYPDDPPALRYLAPFSGCTMAEFLMEDGADVLIVYDDLTKHANAYRELSLLLRRPPGREAYPSDIFYLHARLLERACKLSVEAGGASLTALPIVEIQRGNLAAYIPTNLISITDGQIVLDAGLLNRGIRPAVNVGSSVSRVGGAAQTDAMREISGDLRLELAQYEEVARFARFGTDVDPSTQRQIRRGEHLQAALKQPAHRPLPLARQLIILLAATEGYLDDIAIDEVPAFERDLQDHLESDCPELVGHLERTGELTEEIREQLLHTIEAQHRASVGDPELRHGGTQRSSGR
jgi:F-type H+-transporting ATPase subunit alpha